ncbi:MAG: hypothetical protein JXR63_05120, partial [Spirochaetales bacterium]|nr:hypothetical protein [Spirochaetales bacterium]
ALFGSEDESFEETSLTDSEDSSPEDGDDLSALFGSEDDSFEETSLTDSEDSSPEADDSLTDFDDVSALMDGLLDDSSKLDSESENTDNAFTEDSFAGFSDEDEDTSFTEDADFGNTDGEISFDEEFGAGSDDNSFENESFGDDDIFSLDGFDSSSEEQESEAVEDFSTESLDDSDDDIPSYSLDKDTDDLLSLDVDGFDSFFDSGEFHEEEDDDEPVIANVARSKQSKTSGSQDKADSYDYVITAEELEKIKITLVHLPRNLKIAVEEFIGEGGYPEEDLVGLTSLLVKGAPPKKIAEYVSEKSGENISLPAKYLTMRGVDFLTETTSPWFVFKKKVLPVVIKTAVSAGFIGLAVYMLFVVIIPYFKVLDMYKDGYQALEQRNFHDSVRLFDIAFESRPMKKWVLKYADGYIYNRQYVLAQETYKKALEYRWDKDAILGSARLDHFVFEDYEKSQNLLDLFLEYGDPKDFRKSEYFNDYELRMLSFWNCMKLAETDPDKYFEAGDHLTRIYEKDASNFRLIQALMYFNYVTGKDDLFNDLRKTVFDEIYIEKRKKHIDIPIALEMCEYLYEKNEFDKFQGLIRLLREIDKDIPELYYLQAKYFNSNKKYDDERRNINICLSVLDSYSQNRYFPEARRFIEKDYLAMRAEMFNMRGENNKVRNRIMEAESDFQKSVNIFYNLSERHVVEKGQRFGRIFYNLGTLYYDQVNNLDVAHIQFSDAIENGFWQPDMGYKLGYIEYSNEIFDKSLLQLYQTDLEVPERPAVLYSIANALYQRNNLNSARGYYSHLIAGLESRRKYFAIEIPSKVEHIDILYGLILAYNNHGVASYDLYKRTGDKTYINEAYLSFVQANEYKDRLTRDSVTYERPKWYSDIMDESYPILVANNVPLLNISKMNSPGVDKDLIFFTKIPKNWDVFPFLSSDLKTMADFVPSFDEEAITPSIFD